MLLLLACGPDPADSKDRTEVEETAPRAHDEDGDGYPDDTDCDDTSWAVHPGADERCNGIDDDCDQAVDEADAVDASTWYRDVDGDGHGDPAAAEAACEAPEGAVADSADCDDTRADVSPSATEVCDDEGLDEDCDGLVDDDDASVDRAGGGTWYADSDGDGYGDPASGRTTCDPPGEGTADATDCDDTRPDVFPGAAEACDDAGLDEDCDGLVDDADPDVVGTSAWYADADGDGYGDPAAAVLACAAPAGTTADASDCDDTRADVSPAGVEACDDDPAPGTDEDCDGLVDDEDTATGQTRWYADLDGDGHAGADLTRDACTAPAGYLAAASDCDDGDAAVHPLADEQCDGADNNCDGLVDDADPAIDDPARTAWYADADGDGFGDPEVTVLLCAGADGWVDDATDCDDDLAAVHPAADEDCATAADDDCDGATDAEGALGCEVRYLDPDADGWGVDARCTCVPDDADALAGGDCAEGDPAVHPGAAEACDGQDQDCDGAVDEGLPLYVPDADGDGFGDPAATPSCATAGVLDRADCDDLDATVNPGATEWCDGIDDDCDGLVDADDPTLDGDDWYADADGDGFGDATTVQAACEAPAGFVADDSDCDDAAATTYPGATEQYGNGVDDDCDGEVRPEACDAIYDPELLPTFELTFTDENLYAITRACLRGSQAYHDVTFTYDGESVPAKVRLKGNWSWSCSKYQFVVSFNEDDPDGRFRGLRKIVLDAPWYDPTLLHERLAFPVFDRMGLPSSCANNARVYVNGSYYGLYANVERIDREYLERNFEEPDGNLYQGGSDLMTNEDTADTSDITALRAATTVEAIEALVDLDQATSEWAVEAVLPALDNYWAGVEINYYLYHYPGGKFLYLPYDMDITFGDASYTDGSLLAPDAATIDPIVYEHTGWRKEQLFQIVLADEAWCEIFVDKVAEARAAYDPVEMAADIATWEAQIADAWAEDPRAWRTVAAHEASIALLTDFLQERADYVDAWLAEGGHCPAVW